MRLVKGKHLTHKQRLQVKAAFVYRFTGEHKPRWAITGTRDGGQPYEPTHATDAEWINDHAFYIKKDGTLSTKPGHCEPAWMVDTQSQIR